MQDNCIAKRRKTSTNPPGQRAEAETSLRAGAGRGLDDVITAVPGTLPSEAQSTMPCGFSGSGSNTPPRHKRSVGVFTRKKRP